jgi:hypothetical protein
MANAIAVVLSILCVAFLVSSYAALCNLWAEHPDARTAST